MNPELRKRLIDSIDYLRKMGFFEDYSNLSSEEVLEKIFRGEINYEAQWFVEEEMEKNKEEYLETMKKMGIKTYGVILKESVERDEKHWMEKSDFEVDLRLAPFDRKRVFVEDWEIEAVEGMGISLMKKLARISRGFFQPTDMREELEKKWKDKVRCKVFFKFRGEEYTVDFTNSGEVLIMNPAVKRINELIKDTGYQYYGLGFYVEDIVYIVLSGDEAEKLKRERDWKLYLP